MWLEDLRYKFLLYEKRSILPDAYKRMQEWLKENLPEGWEMEVWPPRSPNYSLLNYFVWGVSGLLGGFFFRTVIGQCKASQQNRGPHPKDEGGDGALRQGHRGKGLLEVSVQD
jgi:hypothetical protein